MTVKGTLCTMPKAVARVEKGSNGMYSGITPCDERRLSIVLSEPPICYNPPNIQEQKHTGTDPRTDDPVK